MEDCITLSDYESSDNHVVFVSETVRDLIQRDKEESSEVIAAPISSVKVKLCYVKLVQPSYVKPCYVKLVKRCSVKLVDIMK